MRKGSLWKKTVSILLSSAMVLTAIPVSASGFEAEEVQQIEGTMEEVPMEGEDTKEDTPGAEAGFQAEEVPEAAGFQAETPEPAEGFSAVEPLEAGAYAGWFDGGEGTEEQPYLISSATQLLKIYDVYLADNQTDYYYKLQNDIDLSTATPRGNVMGYDAFAGTMKGVLDGGGHTVSGAAEYQSLIGLLYGTVKNLTWQVEAAASLVAATCGVSAIEDVTVTGHVQYTSGQGNESPLIYVNDGEKLTMKNVTNKATIDAYGAALYNGIFIGYTAFMFDANNPKRSPQKREYIFENCVNEGDVTGDRIAMFFGNATNMDSALTGKLVHEGEVKKELSITVTNCSNTGSITGIEDAHYLAATMGNTSEVLNALEDQIVSGNQGLTKSSPNFQIVNVGDQYKFETDSQGNAMISIGTNPSSIKTIEINLITYVSYFEAGNFNGTDRYFIQETIPVTEGVTQYRSPLKKLKITDDGSKGLSYTGTGGHIAMTDGMYYFEPNDNYQIGRIFGETATTTPSIFQVNLYDENNILKGVLKSSQSQETYDDIPAMNAATGTSCATLTPPVAGAQWTDSTAVVSEDGQILWCKKDNTMIPVQVNGVPDLESVSLDTGEISLAPGAEVDLMAEPFPKIEGVIYSYQWSSDKDYVKVTPNVQDGSKATVTIDTSKTVATSAVVTVTVSSDISSTTKEASCKVNVTSIAAQVPKIDKDSDISTITTPIAGVEKGEEANQVKENLESLTADIVDTGTPVSDLKLSTTDGTGNAAQIIKEAATESNVKIITVVNTEAKTEAEVTDDAAAIKDFAKSVLGTTDAPTKVSYLDISISVKKVDSSNVKTEIAKITELPKNQALPITVALPSSLQKNKVLVLAYHDDQAIQIKDVVQKDGFVAFPAHLFSTYALVDAGDKFTVNFDTGGGPAVNSQKVAYDGTVSEPADPTWSSHTFRGWYEDADYTTPWDFNNNKITGDTTIYAKWSYNSPAVSYYNVTFDSQGGSAVPAINGVSAYSTIAKPADPTRENFVFGGWFKDAECKEAWDFAKDTVTKDITLYAKWTAKEEPSSELDPVVVKVDSKTTNTVKISWSEFAKAEGYTVWARAEGQSGYQRVAIVSKDAARTYTWKKREPGTKHFFVVKAWIKDENGKYVFSEASKTVRGTTKPEAAKIKKVTVNAAGDLKVTLEGPAKGANRYAMCWSRKADFSRYAIGIRTQYTSRTMVKGLKPGTCYIKVRSYRQMGQSRVYGDWSEAVTAVVEKAAN